MCVLISTESMQAALFVVEESDTAHVGGKIENIAGAPESAQTICFLGKIGLDDSGVGKCAKPKSKGFDIHRPHVGKSMLDEVAHKGAAYETPCTRYQDGCTTVQVRDSGHCDSSNLPCWRRSN